MTRNISRSWEQLRLKDRISPGVRLLFVGINPGVRSAETGHHFAGYSNRFWKLLHESGLVTEPITYEDDDRLPEFGFGITNLVARPTPGIDTLSPREYVDGWKILEKKIARFKPAIVAFVGVTLWRAVLPLLDLDEEGRVELKSQRALGLMPVKVRGAEIFVVPNPSGRNANFSHAEMVEAFTQLKRRLQERESGSSAGARSSPVRSSKR